MAAAIRAMTERQRRAAMRTRSEHGRPIDERRDRPQGALPAWINPTANRERDFLRAFGRLGRFDRRELAGELRQRYAPFYEAIEAQQVQAADEAANEPRYAAHKGD